MTTRSIPLSEPTHGITEELIRMLVSRFYGHVLQDPKLGPIFRGRISHRWEEHLSTMADFWSAVTLKTSRYQGKPHLAHAGLGLSPELFQHWLALFEAAAREICEPDAAAFFTDRARRIADSLQIGLGIGPKALHLDLPATAVA